MNIDDMVTPLKTIKQMTDFQWYQMVSARLERLVDLPLPANRPTNCFLCLLAALRLIVMD